MKSNSNQKSTIKNSSAPPFRLPWGSVGFGQHSDASSRFELTGAVRLVVCDERIVLLSEQPKK